jgi:transcriptional regulator with XRE-family HTH domain
VSTIDARTITFDIPALFDALDQRRTERGLSWQAVAREINMQFANVPGHPVSATTISGIRKRDRVEADGVLQMLRWLDLTPEDFTRGLPDSAQRQPLRHVGPDQILRIDTKAIHARLDAERKARSLAWRQVADEIGGIGASSLTRLAGGGRMSFPDISRVAAWLRCSVASLTHASEL